MLKKISTFILIMLITINSVYASEIGKIATFSDETIQKDVLLDGINGKTYYIKVPKNVDVISASMDVSVIHNPISHDVVPSNVTIDVGNDGINEWEFRDYFGLRKFFEESESELKLNRTTQTHILYPIGASLKEFRMKIRRPETSWWDERWRYRLSVEISENEGKKHSNSIFEFHIDFTKFDVKSAEREVRVVEVTDEGEKELEMQVIDEKKNESKSFEGVVIFKIPHISPYEKKKIEIYFGNKNANARSTYWRDFNTNVFRHRFMDLTSASRNYELKYPSDVGIDAHGRILVVDKGNHRVQVFTSEGLYAMSIGAYGESGDDNEHLNFPAAVDTAFGKIYVADSGNHRIQIFSDDGKYISTVGVSGISGDDKKHLNNPTGVCVGYDGNIYVADTGNNRIQIFDSEGNYIKTVGKDNLKSPTDIAIDENGNLYVADSVNHRIAIYDSYGNYIKSIDEFERRKFGFPCGVDYFMGTLYVADAENQQIYIYKDGEEYESIGTYRKTGREEYYFNYPRGVCSDAIGRIYVADYYNDRVLVFDKKMNYEMTLCGIGEPSNKISLYYVHDIYADDDGKIYVADSGEHCVRVFSASRKLLFTIGVPNVNGDDNEHFFSPRGISADNDWIYIADTYNHRIQIFTKTGMYIGTIGVSGKSGNDIAHLNAPRDVYVYNDKIYVADTYNHRIQIFDKNLKYVSTIGVSAQSGSDNEHLDTPYSIFVYKDKIYVADTYNHRIQIFDLNGTYLSTIGVTKESGNDKNHFNSPRRVTVWNDKIYVADTYNHRIVVFDEFCMTLEIGVAGVEGKDLYHLDSPAGVDVDSKGNIIVGDTDNHRVITYDSHGNHIWTIESAKKFILDNEHLYSPRGIAIWRNYIYISDTNNHRIQIYDTSGKYIRSIGEPGVQGSDNSHLNEPHGIAVSKAGELYVADMRNHRVQVFDSYGVHLRTIGVTCESGDDNSHFNSPHDVDVDDEGNIYVVDKGNHRIQIFDKRGTYKGTIGIPGESGGDNLHFNQPRGIAVYNDKIYVADTGNHRIQIFDKNGRFIRTIGVSGKSGEDNNLFNSPYGIDVFEDRIYVADYNNHRVKIMHESGSLIRILGVSGESGSDESHFNYPYDVCVGYDGTLYVDDRDNHRIMCVHNLKTSEFKKDELVFTTNIRIDMGCDDRIDWKCDELRAGKEVEIDCKRIKSNGYESENLNGIKYSKIQINISFDDGEIILYEPRLIYDISVRINMTPTFIQYSLKYSGDEDYILVPIVVNSTSPGSIRLDSINITYSWNPPPGISGYDMRFFLIGIVCVILLFILTLSFILSKRKKKEMSVPEIMRADDTTPAPTVPERKVKIVKHHPAREKPSVLGTTEFDEYIENLPKRIIEKKHKLIDFDLPGVCIILEGVPDVIYHLFLTRSTDREKHLITIRHSAKMEGRYGIIKNVIHLAISEESTSKRHINPMNMEFDFMRKTLEMISERAIIFIDDIDYLISVNTFENFIRTFKKICDIVSMRRSTLVVSMDPRTLNKKDWALIAGVADRIKTPGGLKKRVKEISVKSMIPSYAYLIKRDFDDIHELLKKIAKTERKLMIVSTKHPDKLKDELKIDAEFLWITDEISDERSVDTKRLNYEFRKRIVTFLRNTEKPVVVLDGLEYILLYNSFQELHMFLKSICDVNSECKGYFIVCTSGRGIDDKGIYIFRRMFDVVIE